MTGPVRSPITSLMGGPRGQDEYLIPLRGSTGRRPVRHCNLVSNDTASELGEITVVFKVLVGSKAIRVPYLPRGR